MQQTRNLWPTINVLPQTFTFKDTCLQVGSVKHTKFEGVATGILAYIVLAIKRLELSEANVSCHVLRGAATVTRVAYRPTRVNLGRTSIRALNAAHVNQPWQTRPTIYV